MKDASHIRLLLADDHTLIREGFKSILGGSELFTVVGEADNGVDVINNIDQTNPDVVLIDINMPRLGGIEVIERLHKTHSHIKFLVLTTHEEREYILKALKAGADGYILKSIERAELQNAIKTVYE
jgi:DNA-binding NarL/FixJ family response regulator